MCDVENFSQDLIFAIFLLVCCECCDKCRKLIKNFSVVQSSCAHIKCAVEAKPSVTTCTEELHWPKQFLSFKGLFVTFIHHQAYGDICVVFTVKGFQISTWIVITIHSFTGSFMWYWKDKNNENGKTTDQLDRTDRIREFFLFHIFIPFRCFREQEEEASTSSAELRVRGKKILHTRKKRRRKERKNQIK